MEIGNQVFTPSVEGETEPAPRDARHSSFLRATIRTIDGVVCQKALVRNLSKYGLKAKCAGTWAVGTVIICELRGVGKIQGKIKWARGNSFGAKFDRPIDPSLTWEASKSSGETEHLARYLHLKPAAPARPSISLGWRSRTK